MENQCPACSAHPGWAHGDESRRIDRDDACRRCYGSGREQRNETRLVEYRDEPGSMTLPQLVAEFGSLKSTSWSSIGYNHSSSLHYRLSAVVNELRKRGALE